MIAWLLALAAVTGAPSAEPRTAQAVIAADESWSVAEGQGDAAHLEQLLLPGYVSVSANGAVTSREAIVRKARARSPSDLARLRTAMAGWRAAHPSQPQDTLFGDTAVLRWLVTGGAGSTSSVDVFVYRGAHWRAAYSQHTGASG